MSNQKMFLYGLGGSAVMFLGAVLMGVGVMTLLFNKWVAFFLLIVGVGTAIKGKAMRFDFKRQSGYIMHKGDW